MITDNGSNMVKAGRELMGKEGDKLVEMDGVQNYANDETDDDEDTDNEATETESVEASGNNGNTVNEAEVLDDMVVSGLHCFPCLAHTLQLVVKDGLKVNEVQTLPGNCHGIVCKIRISSVATEKLLEKCWKTLINDVPTKWSSTFLMFRRLLTIRGDLTEVFS